MNPEDSALLRVIASTDKRVRPFGLIEISNDIKFLVNYFGNMAKVAELVGISAGMLNQFLKVDKLSDEALALVKNRKIDSVSIVNSLSKFPKTDQSAIVSYVLEGKMNSLDIRFLLPLKTKLPNEPIEKLIKKLKDSENIKVSVINFPLTDTVLSEKQIEGRFEKIAGTGNILSVVFDHEVGTIKMSSEGEKNFRKEARTQKKDLNRLTYSLLK